MLANSAAEKVASVFNPVTKAYLLHTFDLQVLSFADDPFFVNGFMLSMVSA